MDRIAELLEQLNIRDYVNLNRRLELARELERLAREAGDTFAQCKALSEIGFTYLTKNDFKKCTEYARKTIEVALDAGEYGQAGVSYNLLGSVYSLQLREPESLPYFHKALDCFRKAKDDPRTATAYMNLGNLYFSIEAYEHVKDNYTAAEFFIDESERNNGDDSNDLYYRAVLNFNMTLVNLELGEYGEARRRLDYINTLKDRDFFANFEQNLNAAEAHYAYGVDDTESFLKYATALVELLPSDIGSDIENVLDYIKVFDNLMESGEHDLAGRLIEGSAKIVEDSESPSLKMLVHKRLLAYYKLLGDKAKIQKEILKYYDILCEENDDIDKRQQSTLIGAIEEDPVLKTDIYPDNELAETGNLDYYDMLTGSGNRNFLRAFELSAFVDALGHHVEYSVIVVDIDSFKAFNKVFGYNHGDRCLQLMAQAIQESVPGSFVARFGGDEFFIISTGLSAEGTRKLCGIIKEKIEKGVTEKLKKEHSATGTEPAAEEESASNITVSIGFYSAIPEAGETHYDFISRADTYLYRSKLRGPGGIMGN